MAFIPVLNCVQARIIWGHTPSGSATNVMYYATASVPTEDDLNEIGDLIQNFLGEQLAPTVSTQWTAESVVLRAMNEAEGIEITYLDGFPVEMSNASGETPLQVAYSVTFGTGLVGRSARGRLYGVGLPANAISGENRLSDAAQADLTTRWQALVDASDAGGHALQVVSFIEGGVPRAEGRKLPVLSAQARFPLATQRRRL
jgi:hypothetical protein